jgi:hypothetical protein
MHMSVSPLKTLSRTWKSHVSRSRDATVRANFEARRAEFYRLFASPSLKDLINLEIALGMMASWYGSVGLAEIATDGERGWEHVAMSCSYGLVGARIRQTYCDFTVPALYVSRGRIGRHFSSRSLSSGNRIPLYIAYSYVHNLTGHWNALGGHLVTALSASDFQKTSSSLSYLMAWIYSQVEGRQFAPPSARFGRYHDLILGSASGAAVPQILTMCDYHCDRIYPKMSDMTDFALAPFDIIPYEIIAYMKYVGLSEKEIDHPLLDSKLITRVDLPVYVDDYIRTILKTLDDLAGKGPKFDLARAFSFLSAGRKPSV